jgi:formamidopyrimidine-DNA glycosylase
MPEMPEVESLARWFHGRTVGLTIERVDLLAISALKTFDPSLKDLVGRRIVGWSRRGKYLIAEADPADQIGPDGVPVTGSSNGEPIFLCMHLARAGWLKWQEDLAFSAAAKPGAKPKLTKGPQALRVVFSDGSGFTATEAGTDKRLAVHVVRNPDDVEKIRTLGIDPLSDAFTVEAFASLLTGQGRSQIKGVLTDQSLLAGVGNAYSDEALHVAKLSPFKPSNGLSAAEAAALHGAVIAMLTEAIERSAGKPASELKDAKRTGMRVHARTGQLCPTCGDTVREVSFATKSIQYCATCQTGGTPLADRRLSRLLK